MISAIPFSMVKKGEPFREDFPMKLALVLILMAIIAIQRSPGQDSPSRVEYVGSLIAVSGASSFGHTLPSLGTTILLTQRKMPRSSAGEALATLLERSFPPDSTAKHLRESFEARYNPSQFDMIIDWFLSPLGKKIVEAERSETLLSGSRRRELRERVRSQWVSNRRLLLLGRLDRNLGLGQRRGTYALVLLEDLIVSLNRDTPANDQISDAEVQQMLLTATDRLETRLPDSVILDMRVTYRSLSNDDLQSYNEFLESFSGRWYLDMLRRGMEDAFLEGQERFLVEVTTIPLSSRRTFLP
jgi:hypothetical protein